MSKAPEFIPLSDAAWRIEQYFLSLAVPNDKAEAVVAVIKGPN